MRRRTPRTGSSCPSSAPSGCVLVVDRLLFDRWVMTRSRSACTTRPPVPDPDTVPRSIPSVRARARTAGAAVGRSRPAGGVVARSGSPSEFGASPVPLGGGNAVVSPAGAGAVASESGTGSGGPLASRSDAVDELAPPVSISTRSLPTASTSPGSPWRTVTTPVVGEDTSTVALSVSTSASTESGVTSSPTATSHDTSSASATPSPTSGSFIRKTLTMRAAPASLCRRDRVRGSTTIRERAGTGCPTRTLV